MKQNILYDGLDVDDTRVTPPPEIRLPLFSSIFIQVKP